MLFIKLIAQKKIKTYSMTNKFVLLTFWQIAWINSCQVSILNFISYFVFTHIIIGMKQKVISQKSINIKKRRNNFSKNLDVSLPGLEDLVGLVLLLAAPEVGAGHTVVVITVLTLRLYLRRVHLQALLLRLRVLDGHQLQDLLRQDGQLVVE